jgi:hypothetical protein
LAAGADGDVGETLRVSFAHQKSPISGDARQGVPSGSTQPAVRSEKQQRFSVVSAWIARFRRSFCGFIESPTAFLTRRRSRERSSREPTRTPCVLVTAKPTRVAVDETAVRINDEWSWLYAAIDVDTKLLLDVELFSRHGTNPAAAFLHRLREKHGLSETVFLVDQSGYRTALSRSGLNGQVDYVDRNHIENWFHTLKMRIDRFHS